MRSFDSAGHELLECASPVEIAVVWVQKAERGSVAWIDSASKEQIRWYRLRKRTKQFTAFVQTILLLLSSFEHPSWCRPWHCSHIRADLFVSGLPMLPLSVVKSIEIGCLFVLLLRYKLRSLSLGQAHERRAWDNVIFFLIGMCVVDTVATICTQGKGGMLPWNINVSMVCRVPIVFLSRKHLRNTAMTILMSIPMFAGVLVVLAICVCVFAWVGLIIFAKTTEGNEHFNDWSEALASMWILFTTANNPDVWLPAYRENRFSVLFFLFYLVLTLILLSNLLLAAVFQSYKSHVKTSLKSFFDKQRHGLSRAFALLATDGAFITRESWSVFFVAYCNRLAKRSLFHCFVDDQDRKDFLERSSHVAFEVLVPEGSDVMDLASFERVISVLSDVKIPWSLRHPSNSLDGFSSRIRIFWRRGVFVRNWHVTWAGAVDVLVFCDVVLALLEGCFFVSPGAGGKFADIWTVDARWVQVRRMVSFVFAAELVLRVVTLGSERLWYGCRATENFDVCALCVRLWLETRIFHVLTLADASRFLLVIRYVQGVRLLVHIPLFWYLGSIMSRLVRTYNRSGQLVGLVLCFYAIVGEELFGGLVYESNPALKGSDFAALGYWNLNFNDIPTGLTTLFVLSIVNNWFVIADGMFRVAQGNQFVCIYFVSFFIIVNLILLNVVVTLIIECFGTVRRELQEDQHAWNDELRRTNATMRRRGSSLMPYSMEEVLSRVFPSSVIGPLGDSGNHRKAWREATGGCSSQTTAVCEGV
eukprot:TRINITY_DN8554_c0_g1_i1.p1 TRINITY_DN8554_c0_g1~~TRINITY_DN8554_c0_g1_i1.p1  ORF type:complete len:758 (-),score=68.32 TRINITY_DN8554_c0_g1_i1:365-2638(-)